MKNATLTATVLGLAGCPTASSVTPEPESCWDGVDNDSNGLTDCADSACEERFDCRGKLIGSDTALLEGQSWTTPTDVLDARHFAIGEFDGHPGPDFVLGLLYDGPNRATWFSLSSRRSGGTLESEGIALPLSSESGTPRVESRCDVDADGLVDIFVGETRFEPPAVVRHVLAADIEQEEWGASWEVSSTNSSALAECLGRPDDLEQPRLVLGRDEVRLTGSLTDTEFPFTPVGHRFSPPDGFTFPSSELARDWDADGYEDLIFPADREESAGATWVLGWLLPGGPQLAVPADQSIDITEESPPAFPLNLLGVPGPSGPCCELALRDVTGDPTPDLLWRIPADWPGSERTHFAAGWSDGSQLTALEPPESLAGGVQLLLTADPTRHGTVSLTIHDAADFDGNGTRDLLVSGFVSVGADRLPELPPDTEYRPEAGATIVGVYFDVDSWEPEPRNPLASLGGAIVMTHPAAPLEHVSFTEDLDGGGVRDVVVLAPRASGPFAVSEVTGPYGLPNFAVLSGESLAGLR